MPLRAARRDSPTWAFEGQKGSASRLFELARVLDVPIMWFFEDLDPKQGQRAVERRSDTASEEAMPRRETLELVRVYYQIEDPKLRRKLYEMAKALAEQ